MIELRINGASRHFEVAPTVSDILAALDLTNKRVAVERNSMIVPRSQHADTRCAEGDTIEIVIAVGGG